MRKLREKMYSLMAIVILREELILTCTHKSPLKDSWLEEASAKNKTSPGSASIGQSGLLFVSEVATKLSNPLAHVRRNYGNKREPPHTPSSPHSFPLPPPPLLAHPPLTLTGRPLMHQLLRCVAANSHQNAIFAGLRHLGCHRRNLVASVRVRICVRVHACVCYIEGIGGGGSSQLRWMCAIMELCEMLARDKAQCCKRDVLFPQLIQDIRLSWNVCVFNCVCVLICMCEFV